MAASLTDKITETNNGTRPAPAALTAQKPIGATELTVNSLAGWPTATSVHFILYKVDNLGKRIEGTQTDWKGIVADNKLTQLTLKAGTDDLYPAGSIVKAAPTSAWADDLYEWGTLEHNKVGKHGNVNADSVTSDGLVKAKNGFQLVAGTFVAPNNSVQRSTLEKLPFATAMYSGAPQNGQVIPQNTETVLTFDMTDPNSYGVTLDTNTRALVTERDGFYTLNVATFMIDGSPTNNFIIWIEVALPGTSNFTRMRQFDRSLNGQLSVTLATAQLYAHSFWLPQGAKVRVTAYSGNNQIRLAAANSGSQGSMTDTDIKRYLGTNMSLVCLG